MADSHKRKRAGESSSQSLPKKTKIDKSQSSPESIKVTTVVTPQYAPPVVATTPGISLPDHVDFHAYSKLGKAKKRKDAVPTPAQEMMLHSEEHARMDFTAREDRPEIMNKVLKHYVGAFDPKTGELQIMEARKMVVRGTVRARKAQDEAMVMPIARKGYTDMKTELGESFGTKKARKALKSAVENAIRRDKNAKLDSGDTALLDVVNEATADFMTQEELAALNDRLRPIPKGNFEAKSIQDVYNVEEIIGPEILKAIPVRDWQDKAKKNEPIQVASRFVAGRVANLAANQNPVPKLRLLRYFYFVLLFWKSANRGKGRGENMVLPRAEKLKPNLAEVPGVVLHNIKEKFSDANEMRKFHIDLLKTHLCLFSVLLDNFETNTFDLREDLRTEQTEINRYFSEIGAATRPLKRDGNTVYFAKLALPLQFPKPPKPKKGGR